MKQFNLALLSALVAAVVAVPALAGKGGPSPTTTITKKSRQDNKVFVGINWNFGVREGLTGLVGYRYAKVSTSDRVSGALADLTFPITGATFGIGELHVKGLAGNRSAQGEAGVGYGFQSSAFLLNAGVRAPYVNAGVDYLFSKGWQPYIGVNSLDKPKAHTEKTTTTCPAGYVLQGSNCILVAVP
jgi:hypothetical protein